MNSAARTVRVAANQNVATRIPGGSPAVPSFDPRLQLVWAARLAFAAALAATLWFAFAPSRGGPPLLPWDKAEHYLAFFVLTGLAMAAFPKVPFVFVAAGMSALGAVIELVQGMPFVHRDCDVWDWVADTFAILSVAAVAVGWQLRGWFARDRP